MIANAVAGPVAIPTMTSTQVDDLRVNQGRVIRSEWLKMRTLRSSWLTLAVAIAAMGGIGIIISWTTVNEWTQMRAREQGHFNPLADPLSGFNLAQLAVGVLGILLIASEYSVGMIRASLTAVPKRLPILWAKLAVFCAITLVTMLPTAIATFFVSQRILSTQHIQTTWSTPTVARTVIGIGLYLTVVAALSIGIGAILRNVAGAIAAFVGIMLVTTGDRLGSPPNLG